MSILPPGKLPGPELERLISTYRTRPDSSVVIEPGYGRDAAAINIGSDGVVIVKSDPITFTTDNAAHFLVAVNANDIACLGGIPRWLSVVALLADGSTGLSDVEQLFADLQKSCDQAGIALIGGHTEITLGLPRTILVGTLIGVPGPGGLLEPGGGEANDDIWLTQSAGIEGTAILANDHASNLTTVLDSERLERARGFLQNPGILVIHEATKISAIDGVVALHDPTEGGVATAIHELVSACNCGAVIERDLIPIRDETSAICGHFGIDPLGLLSSGALLVVAKPMAREELEALSKRERFPLTRIGQLTQDKSVLLRSGDSTNPLPRFDSDEISRVISL